MMQGSPLIVAKAPMRISFSGGMTDIPDLTNYFQDLDGHVIGMTINKFVYVSVLPQPEFENIKYRLTYRFAESVSDFNELSHPVVRAILRARNWTVPLNISTMASLPGRSGMGSSSCFTVAFLAALEHFLGFEIEPKDLALEAIRVEREILREPGGLQDQFQTSFGGLRSYHFTKAGTHVSDTYPTEIANEVASHLVLVATGRGRDSGVIHSKIQEIPMDKTLRIMSRMAAISDQLRISLLTSKDYILELASSINESWALKREFEGTSTSSVDELLKYGRENGAIAAKLNGAGQSGFALFVVPRERRVDFIKQFKSTDVVLPEYFSRGVQVVRQ